MTSFRIGAELLGRRSAVCWAAYVALAVTTWVEPARSQTAQEQALAEALFRDGRELLEREDYAAACGKFGESYRLDPASGTLLNLALCHEREGKLATAWAEYQNALGRVRREGSEDRVAFARESIARVEPLVPRIHLEVVETPGASVSVELGDIPLGRAAWGVAMPVDPGVIRLRASAPGFRPHEETLIIEPGQLLTARLPALEPETGEGLADAAKVVVPREHATPRSEREQRPNDVSGATHEHAESGDARRAAAYVGGGVGALGIAAGTYFGVVAILQKRESDERCSGGECETKEDLSLYETAQLNATLSNIGFGVGLVGLGAGAYLYFTAADESSGGRRQQVSSRRRGVRSDGGWVAAPSIHPGGWGLNVVGRF